MEVKLDIQDPRLSWRAWWQEQRVFCADLWLCHEIKPYKDEPMAPADWDHHQSWHRHCLEPLTYLRVLRVLSVIEAWVLTITLAAGLYATYLQPRPGWVVLVSKDYMALFTLASVALALLITFRTNTAHGRWWEARSLVGRWLAVVRNSQRMFQAWAPPEDAPLVAEFTRWNAALTAVACEYLCRDASQWEFVEDLVTPQEMAWLSAADNPPVAVLAIMTGLLTRSHLSAYERVQIEGELMAFDLMLAGLERITRQAIPRAYTRHTSRCMIAFCTFLPFALFPYLGWLTLPAMYAFTFLLLGIENIGVQIENPVRVLPMHRFSSGNKAVVLYLASLHNRTLGIVDAAAAGRPGRQLPRQAYAPERRSMEQPWHHQQQQQQHAAAKPGATDEGVEVPVRASAGQAAPAQRAAPAGPREAEMSRE